MKTEAELKKTIRMLEKKYEKAAEKRRGYGTGPLELEYLKKLGEKIDAAKKELASLKAAVKPRKEAEKPSASYPVYDDEVFPDCPEDV